MDGQRISRADDIRKRKEHKCNAGQRYRVRVMEARYIFTKSRPLQVVLSVKFSKYGLVSVTGARWRVDGL